MTDFFLKHKSVTTGDWFVFKFLQCSMDGKYLMHFQSEIYVLKFLWHSVEGSSGKRTCGKRKLKQQHMCKVPAQMDRITLLCEDVVTLLHATNTCLFICLHLEGCFWFFNLILIFPNVTSIKS